MKQSILEQNKKATMLCEKGMTIVETRSALSVPNKQHQWKHRVIQGRLTNIAQNVGWWITMWRHVKRRKNKP